MKTLTKDFGIFASDFQRRQIDRENAVVDESARAIIEGQAVLAHPPVLIMAPKHSVSVPTPKP